MPSKKKVEEKIEFSPEAFMSMTDTMIEKHVVKMLGPHGYAFVKCLKEFGISGMQLLAFVSRFGELNAEYSIDDAMEECCDE